jgi:urease accessory protein
MKARLPKVYGDEPKTAVLINTAGGLTGGDRVAARVDWRPGADACLTTQAAERIYRSTGRTARIDAGLTVADGASAEWLPQETILFERGRFRRRTLVELSDGSRFLGVESLVLGRRAMGERIHSALIDDGWLIRRGGRPVLRDSFVLDGDFQAHRSRGARLGSAGAWATLFAQTDRADETVAAIRRVAGKLGGATALRGLVAGRVAAGDGDALRRVMAELIPELRATIFGRAPRLPRVFQI